jgi:hypothetical protein
MNSTPDLKVNEAEDALAARADERLAHAYKQIADADEQLARLTDHLAKMEHDDIRHAPPVSRPKPSRERSPGGTALRGFIGLVSAACVIAAALVSQSSYGEAAKPLINRWAPSYLVSPQWVAPAKSALQGQPSASAVQVAAAEAPPVQAAASVRTTAQEVAPAPPEVTRMLQEIARVLANVEQEVEQLKAGQERLASDNAKVVEELRASQEQATRRIARTSEQSLAPKTTAPLPRPSPTRKPVATQASPQARAQPQAPVQLQPDDQ